MANDNISGDSAAKSSISAAEEPPSGPVSLADRTFSTSLRNLSPLFMWLKLLFFAENSAQRQSLAVPHALLNICLF